MGWGLCIHQDEDGFVQIPDADFFTDASDYEGIPPHAYDLIYERMEEHRRDIDMARDEGTLELARETAMDAFECAKSFDYEDDRHKWRLHHRKMKELQEAVAVQTQLLNKNKPLIEEIKETINLYDMENADVIKKLKSEIDELEKLYNAKNDELQKILNPVVELEEKMTKLSLPKETKRKLQKIMLSEKEWASEQ